MLMQAIPLQTASINSVQPKSLGKDTEILLKLEIKYIGNSHHYLLTNLVIISFNCFTVWLKS